VPCNLSLPRPFLSAPGHAAALAHQRGEIEGAASDCRTGKHDNYHWPARWTLRGAREARW